MAINAVTHNCHALNSNNSNHLRARRLSSPVAVRTCGSPGIFGSRHIGVIQFGFGDWRVQVIAETIDPAIWDLLGERNDGKVLPNY